jgi:hypothetical protein
MDKNLTGGPDDLTWASVEACTLPTVERPLRVAEFDDLFATSLRSADLGGTRARLLLAGDEALPGRVRRLTDAESACCSFFSFTITALPGKTSEGSLVALDIDVPPAYADVLAALVDRAEAALGPATGAAS